MTTLLLNAPSICAICSLSRAPSSPPSRPAMITFSPDHSAVLGLIVFSGFALATGSRGRLSAWIVFSRGERPSRR